MAEYTLKLESSKDYQIIKKLLKAFEGASITPVKKRKSSIEISLEEARKGKVQGPFNSVEELMTNLKN
ncbi:MAG: hypothetical protein K2K23_07465 [Muribaculaceae bacterium]|nr:hypothetical protein [Muribaculaceae bacterium]